MFAGLRASIRGGIDFPTMAGLLILLAATVLACLAPAQSDTFWQLRAGQDTWRDGAVPLRDTYSYTALGMPWPNHSWLWQAAAYGLWRLGGFPLLTIANAALLVAAVVLSFTLVKGDPRRRLIPLAAALPVMASEWALRPQGASLFLLALLLHLLVRERYWWIPVVFLIWANVHGSVALGGLVLVTACAVAAGRWWAERGVRERSRLGRLTVVTLAAGLATLVTPLGPGLWTYVVTSVGRSKENNIDEWASAFQWGLVEALFWGWAAALVLVGVLRWRRLSAPPERLLLVTSLVLLPLAANSIRNIPAFVLAAMPVLIAATRPADGLVPGPRGDKSLVNTGLALAAAVASLVLVAGAWTNPPARLGWDPLPRAAQEAITACPGNLYNRFDEGGYIIWLVPQTPVFVDNRQDPYPQDFLERHIRTEMSGDYREIFADHGIECAALPVTSATAQSLEADGWTSRYRDAEWLVFYPPTPTT